MLPEMYVAAGRGSGVEGVMGSPLGSLLPRLMDISQLWEKGLGRAGSKQPLSCDESFTGAQCYNEPAQLGVSCPESGR